MAGRWDRAYMALGLRPVSLDDGQVEYVGVLEVGSRAWRSTDTSAELIAGRARRARYAARAKCGCGCGFGITPQWADLEYSS